MKPFQRTNSVRVVYRKTPSGSSRALVRRRKSNKSTCAICKKPLRGSVGSKQRIYGGYICHRCLQHLIKSTMRGTS
ncbi:sigma factor G inhibitor Gin [Metallosphaera hakonensis]|uniref:50S ribosomal protein L34e n=1 Tax=Metallosphaera hakonensis JCM 8857 = DSM 7519 TaxID=1293036 RepID=A0A2U9ITJ8_9CREN|nr:sigma factor G inhibitor Gin [Metallosphaera hakonensis]AWR99390.1 50S ribosomal protein L34e [Metallosphaera hakonensis JCM 8857 = DSM 7519]